MTPQAADPLAQLHPLREPAAISAWPPAPGWWLLAALVLVMISVGLFLWWRHYQRQAYRRAGLKRLQVLRAEYESTGDTAAYVQAVNGLLKAIALNGFPRREVAAVNGDQWLAFLRETMDAAWDLPAELADAPYRAEPGIDMQSIHRAAAHWIQSHRVPA